MSITEKDISHIADLARIKLTAEEKEKFAVEISTILQFVERLSEVDTVEVLPMNGGGEAKNRMRPDIEPDVSLEGRSDRLLEPVSDRADRLVRVKAVFE